MISLLNRKEQKTLDDLMKRQAKLNDDQRVFVDEFMNKIDKENLTLIMDCVIEKGHPQKAEQIKRLKEKKSRFANST